MKKLITILSLSLLALQGQAQLVTFGSRGQQSRAVSEDVGYGVEVTQAISQLNSEPAVGYQDGIEGVVQGLVDNGDWPKFVHLTLDNLDTKANAYSDISEANQEDMVETGSMVFTATEGVAGTGVNDQYLNTKFQASVDHNSIILDDDAIYGVFIRTAMTDTDLRYIFGARDSQSPDKSQVGIFDDSGASGELQGYHHDDGGFTEVATTAAEAGDLLYVMRDGTTNTAWLKEGTTILDTNAGSQPTGGLLEREIVLFATDIEGSILFETDFEIIAWFVCAGDVDMGAFKTLLETYKTAIDAI